MTNKQAEALISKIKDIKEELSQIENMRPGSVTKQFYKRGDKKWPYWQISYTQNKKSKTEYLKDEFVDEIKIEVKNYKKFKKLIEKLVEFNIQLSKEKLSILKNTSKN